MKIHRICLEIKAPILTPLYADTIWGQLCWTVAHKNGNSALQEFLEPFRNGEPSFLISDGFPAGYLPKPLSLDFSIKDPVERKEMKKIDYLPSEYFCHAINGASFEPYGLELPIQKKSTTSHNAISRITNTTVEGSLYSLEEAFIPRVDIYIKVKDEEWKNKLKGLFEDLSKSGYGKKKSIGKGQFCIEDILDPPFSEVKDANAFVTLSSFCPREDDPTEGIYKTFVKYGKLGEEFNFCGNPFKKPLLMVKTGSVFKTQGQPKEIYGRIIEKIAPAKAEVVQYAYAFAVPIRING